MWSKYEVVRTYLSYGSMLVGETYGLDESRAFHKFCFRERSGGKGVKQAILIMLVARQTSR